jgi:hypothetical protein
MPIIVAPPARTYARARSWKMFHALFAPICQANGEYLHEPEDVPKDADPRHWWTVVDLEPSRPVLYLEPGLHRANRLGHVRCERPWSGNADDHPLYVYQ